MTRYLAGLALTAAVLVAPAVARGATVSADSATHPNISYRAGTVEANDLSVDFSGNTVFSDGGAFVVAGRNCTQTGADATCPPNPQLIDVLLRDFDDKASILGFPQLQNLRLSGGGGNDKAVGVAVNDVQLNGDAGDDELTAEADVTATANGGSGDDVVNVEPFLATGHAIGGSGDDQLYFRPAGGGASNAQMQGDTGADILVAHPAASAGSTLDGGDGNDVIVIRDLDPLNGHGLTVAGGQGDDTMFGGPLADSIDAGPGRDVVDVRGGGADTVTCGGDVDVVRYDAADTVAADCEVQLQD